MRRDLSILCDEPHLTIAYAYSKTTYTRRRYTVPVPKLTKLEFKIMEALWAKGAASIREIQEAFPMKGRPAYTTVQTTIYRMEGKEAVHRVRRVSNFDIFAASISREGAQRRLIDDLLDLIGGSSQPIMSHLIDAGKLSLKDIKEAERVLQTASKKERRS
jgi:BlaI family penicillinase repressor